MIAKLKKQIDTNDIVVIISDDGTADIASVYDTDDTAIYASSSLQDYAIPKSDAKSHVGARGRIYVVAADSDYISDTQRLAKLEQSIVLRQVTNFAGIDQRKKIDIKQIMLYMLIGILLLAVVFK